MDPKLPEAPEVKASHYISHFALRNWAHPATREVRIFDFSTGTFDTRRPRDTYVAEAPFPPDVEKWLKLNIEDPVGEFVGRLRRKPRPGASRPEPNEREWRAIALWTMTQPLRTALARDPTDTMLVEMVRGGAAFVDGLVHLQTERTKLSVILAARERFYFPEGGMAALPLVGGVGWFVPLHPRIAATVVPRSAVEGVGELLEREGMATALSAGLIGDLLVIPPLADDADLAVVESCLRQARASAERLTRVMVEVNRRMGIELAQEWDPPAAIDPSMLASEEE